MAPRRTPATGHAQLLAFLLSPAAGRPSAPTPDPLADELDTWLSAAPRFRAFADANRDKIRKKLRVAHGPEARLDVRLELAVARRLIADRHFELAFEPGGARGGPDFSLTYRQGQPMNLEVTRVRRLTDVPSPTRQILAKLRQLPTGDANVLLLAVPAGTDRLNVSETILALRARADAKEGDFFTRRGFSGTRDFYDRFLRLGAIVSWSESSATVDAWVNRSARVRVPNGTLDACIHALVGEHIDGSRAVRHSQESGSIAGTS